MVEKFSRQMTDEVILHLLNNTYGACATALSISDIDPVQYVPYCTVRVQFSTAITNLQYAFQTVRYSGWSLLYNVMLSKIRDSVGLAFRWPIRHNEFLDNAGKSHLSRECKLLPPTKNQMLQPVGVLYQGTVTYSTMLYRSVFNTKNVKVQDPYQDSHKTSCLGESVTLITWSCSCYRVSSYLGFKTSL